MLIYLTLLKFKLVTEKEDLDRSVLQKNIFIFVTLLGKHWYLASIKTSQTLRFNVLV